MAKHWIFQDESGEPGEEIFIVGILCATPRVKRMLLNSIKIIRDRNMFYDEMHFQTFSNIRNRVYGEVIDEAFNFYFTFKSIVVKSEDIDLSYFNNKKHLAYNKFSQLLIYSHMKNRDEEIHIRPDEKNRMNEDNFYDYLIKNLNEAAFLNGHKYIVKSCKSSKSNICDIIQLCDLLTGIVKNKYLPAGQRKNDFAEHMLSKYASKINIWEWKPRKKL